MLNFIDITSPRFYNEIPQGIIDDLVVGCDWFDHIYGIASVGLRRKGDADHRFPRIWTGDKTKYLDLYPDKNRKAFGFFELLSLSESGEDEFTVIMRFVVWANMEKINPALTHDFTDQLALDVKRKIRTGNSGGLVTQMNLITEPREVWGRYDYNFDDLKQVAFPNTTFAWQFQYLWDGCDREDFCNEASLSA